MRTVGRGEAGHELTVPEYPSPHSAPGPILLARPTSPQEQQSTAVVPALTRSGGGMISARSFGKCAEHVILSGILVLPQRCIDDLVDFSSFGWDKTRKRFLRTLICSIDNCNSGVLVQIHGPLYVHGAKLR